MEYDATLALRDGLLRKPLGLRFTEVELAKEETSYHFGGWIGTDLAACLVLTPSSETRVQLRQCVVREELRGKGYGKKIVQFAETFAREHRYRQITMHARVTAIGFYEKLGYLVEGEPYIEVTIPHVTMGKDIQP